MLDGLLDPHSSIPYIQMGRSIALYTVSLLFRDSCEEIINGERNCQIFTLKCQWFYIGD